MPNWTAFAVFVGVVLVVLLILARKSEAALSEGLPHSDEALAGPREKPDSAAAERPEETIHLSTAALLANVALSQVLFAVLIIGAAWVTNVPAWAFGLGADAITLDAIGLGVAVGLGLYVVNEIAATAGRKYGFSASEEVRSALAPETAAGWVVLLLVVLPIIASFEELLFRGALVGAMAVGFDVSPWLLAIGSSVVFAFGHGAQGRLGILVTGVLGFVLAAVFVVTGSLLVVIVAHYVINALEFVVHEGLEIEWTEV